ncbi:MAG TPA: TetR/AcrR family transcriptional regulator [Candidatus Acidoferrales bacterium]|jgi:AcrR family transcriptional regulator|nr:TetR/AcrR family transcriptional regulator [Candidatus Acidoferrales bacterium]
MRTSLEVRQRRRAENDARAARIMTAAARVFARRGVENATMEMIAREARVAVGTIYLHFASRDEVYLNLCAERGTQLGVGYRAVIARGLKPLDEIRTLAQVYIEYLHESADPILISEPIPYSEIRKRLRRSSEIRAFDRGSKIRREVFGLFESSVKRAFDRGLVADSLGATGVTIAIWSILNGAFMVTRDREYLVHTIGFEPQGFVAKALESYLQGLAAAACVGIRQSKPAQRRNRPNEMQGKGTGL